MWRRRWKGGEEDSPGGGAGRIWAQSTTWMCRECQATRQAYGVKFKVREGPQEGKRPPGDPPLKGYNQQGTRPDLLFEDKLPQGAVGHIDLGPSLSTGSQ